MAPAVVLLLLSALTGITLNAYRRFAAPAAGDLALQLGPIVAIVWLSPQLGIEALALGFVAGGALRLGTHVLGLGRRLRLAHLPTADGRDARWRMGKLMLPLLLGSTFAQLAELGDDYFASLVGAGGVSARTFAKSLRDLPLEVLPYALSVVLFPYFAALDASGRAAELRRLFGRTAHGLAIAFAALSVVMIVFAEPIVSLALERGRFGVEQRLLTVGPLRMFGLGMVAFAVETVLVNYFFARQNTLTPILCGMLAVGVNLTLCALLVGPMGVSGVALALTIAKSFKVVLLGWLLVRGDHGAALACVFALLRLLPSTALSTAACLGYAHVWPVDLGTAPALAKLLHLLGGAAVGGTVFFASLFVLSPRERPLLAAIPSLVRRVLGSAMRNVRR
jgi:putative peptidoglycan lipid II flippase